MSTIEKISKLDNEFINIDNQTIIDSELVMFLEFENSRNALIVQLEEEFKNSFYSDKEKEIIIKKLKASTHKVITKFNSIKSVIKQNNFKTQQFKNAYQYIPKVEGSFFIDKSI